MGGRGSPGPMRETSPWTQVRGGRLWLSPPSPASHSLLRSCAVGSGPWKGTKDRGWEEGEAQSPQGGAQTRRCPVGLCRDQNLDTGAGGTDAGWPGAAVLMAEHSDIEGVWESRAGGVRCAGPCPPPRGAGLDEAGPSYPPPMISKLVSPEGPSTPPTSNHCSGTPPHGVCHHLQSKPMAWNVLPGWGLTAGA